MDDSNVRRLEFATQLARRAGELGSGYFREIESLTIENKGHQDLVSNGDREVELLIRAAIVAEFPQDGIVGEEYAATKGSSGYVWVIDPIDGTANFVRGIPAWCVVIACVKDGKTVVGVVHEPSTGETFYARRGGGAFLNGKPIRAATAATLGEGSVGIGFNNRTSAQNAVTLIGLIVGEGGVFFRNASGALMLSYVAAGRLIAYSEEHMNAWDCLAAMLLIEEAGGIVETSGMSTVLEDGTMVIAGGTGVFDKVRALSAQAFNL